jgi:hypothetical protein
MAYGGWNHFGISFQSESGDLCPGSLHFIRYNVPVDVHCCLDVAVSHEPLLHTDCGPNLIQPRTIGMTETMRSQPS